MSVGSLAKIIGYMLLICLVAAIVAGTVVAYAHLPLDNPEPLERQPTVTSAWQTVRTAFSRLRGQGEAVGRAVPGVDPPSIAERLTALAAAPASQHVVTPNQEVVMTGTASHTCLGGDNEVMLEVKNDIGADQLDISYSLENLLSAETSEQIAARVVKLASCGPRSIIKQCIPLAPHGRGVRLHTLAYYYEAASVPTVESETPIIDSNGMVNLPPKRTVSGVREEARVYPNLFDNTALKSTAKVELNASAFTVSA